MLKKVSGCGDRDLEIVFWPRPDEERETKWIIVLTAILPQVHNLMKLYQVWEQLTWNEKKKVESRIRRSVEKEKDSNICRNFRLTQYLISAFKKWSTIQDQLGAPGCDVDVSCLTGRCETDLLNMIYIMEEIMQVKIEKNEPHRRHSRFNKIESSPNRSKFINPKENSINVETETMDDNLPIVHNFDASGDAGRGNEDAQIVVPIYPVVEQNDSSSDTSSEIDGVEEDENEDADESSPATSSSEENIPSISETVLTKEDIDLVTEDDGLVTEDDGLVTEDDVLVTEDDGLVLPEDLLVLPEDLLVLPEDLLVLPEDLLVLPEDLLVGSTRRYFGYR